MPSTEPAARGRSAARDSGLLGLAAAAAGLAAYVFVSIGTRTYGATAFAPVAVLWTLWVAASAALTFPLQHWTIRAVAVDGGEGGVRSQRRTLVRVLIPTSAVVLVVLTVAREQVFLDDSLVYPVATAALVPLSATHGLARGLLAARKRFGALAALIASENVVRVVALAALVALDLPVTVVPGALLAGFLVLLAWPSSLRIPALAMPPRDDLRSALQLASGQVMGQLLLAGPPVVLALLDAPAAAVTALFSAMALLRAPHLLLLGASPRLTDALVGDDHTTSVWVRRVLLGGLVATPAVAALAGPVVRWLLPLVFGPTVSLALRTSVVATAGGWLALLTLAATLLALAEGRSRRIGPAWGIAALLGTPVLVVGARGALTVVTWLAATELAAFALLLWQRSPQAPTDGHHSPNDRSH